MRSTSFTTYLKTIEDKATEAAYDRLADKAVRAYATISRAADQASAATAGLIGGRGSAGLGLQVNSALKSRANETRAVALAQERAAVSSGKYSAALGREALAAKHADASNSGLARSLRATATSLQVVQGPLGPLAGRVTAVANALEQLTGFRLGIAGVGAALFGLAQQANKYTEIRSKLVPLFKSQTEVNGALTEVAAIAKRARTSLEPVADLYSRLTLAGRDFGFSQARVARLTELATKAATLSGGSNQSRSAGLSQFSQALGSGNLGGDELRSIKENTLVLAQSIAQGFKNADGSIGTTIGNLKELGSQGKLSSVQIADALDRSARKIEESYARLPKTLATSSAALGNQFLLSIGNFDQAIGFTRVLAEGLSLVSDNLTRIIALAAGVGTAFAILKGIDIAKGAASSIAAVIATREQVKTLDAAWIADAQAARASATVSVAALEAEQVQIRENIALLERKRAVAARDAVRYTPDLENGYAGSSRLAAQAAEEEKKVVTALIREKQQLGVINNALVGANGRVTASTQTLATATENVTRRTGLFKSALGGILGIFGGPWGLALTAATTALYLFATAESNAERATRLHEDAQRSFASIIDATTGKIYGQITSLEILAKKKATQDSGEANAELFRKQRLKVQNVVQQVGAGTVANVRIAGLSNTPADAKVNVQLRALGERFAKGTITFDDFDAQLKKLAKTSSRVSSRLPEIAKAFTDARETNRRLQIDAAGLRIGTPNQRATDVALYTGKLTAAELGARKSDKVLNAEAAARSNLESTDPRQKAVGTRDTALLALNKARAGGLGDDEYLQQREQILRTYDQEVQGIKASSAARSAGAAQARKDAAAARRDAATAAREAEDARKKAISDAREIADAKAQAANEDLAARQPALSRQQYLDEQLAILKAQDDAYNAAGKLKKLEDDSDLAGKQRLKNEQAIGVAISESRNAYERQYQTQLLLLAGRNDEAAALQVTLELVDKIGDKGYGEYSRLLAQVREQGRINDLLASRERIVSALTGVLDTARDGFAQFLVDLPEKGAAAGGDFLKSIDRSLRQAAARQITERLFAGADQKVRDLISGKSGVEQQTDFLASQMNVAGTSSEKLASAFDAAATTITAAADRISSAGTLSPSSGASPNQPAYLDPTGAIVITAPQYGSKGGNPATALDRDYPSIAPIDIKNSKSKPQLVELKRNAYQLFGDAVGQAVGGPVGKVLGNVLGDAYQGYALGSQIGGLLGGKEGAAKGGAIGGALSGAASLTSALSSGSGALASAASKASPYVAAVVAGFQIGTSIGKLLAPKPRANALITSVYDKAVTYGNNEESVQAVKQTVDTVQSTLSKVIDSLGGTAGAFRVSIGQYKDYFRVSANGSDAGAKRAPNTASSQIIYDGKDGAEATRIAILNAIQDGAVQGIRAGAQRLLSAGRDLESAVNKALKFQNVFDRLKQKTDPVGFAVQQLNKEFTNLISIFKEAGATSQEYADLEKLYGLERADAIKQATNAASSAIDQFLKDMVSSSSSPLNKLDTYNNAGSDLNKYRADITAGKTVDQNELLSAARNFQDASRNLNGSGQAFFDDFNSLRDLLTKARDNAGITNVTNLPGSPLSADSTVQAEIAKLSQSGVAATQSQTEVLGSKLDALIRAVQEGGANIYSGGSSFGGLPGFGQTY